MRRVTSTAAITAGMAIVLAASLTFFLMTPAFADPAGDWRVADGSAVVHIKECGSQTLCGFIASAPGPAQRDMRNPDRSKRNRPIIGIEVLIGMKQEKPGTWAGKSYNAEDGQTYSSRITEKGDALEVEGCAPGGGNCGTETWSRTK